MLKRRLFVDDVDSFREKVFSSPTIELTGIIRYDPDRGSLKNNKSCCIVEIDSGLSDFYRDQVNKEFGLNLKKPSWGTHISVVQGSINLNDPLFKKYWKKYEGLEVYFKYYAYPRFNGDTVSKGSEIDGNFWFIDVECPFANKIRNELGMDSYYRPHITIGKK